jgi:hypothetical protein
LIFIELSVVCGKLGIREKLRNGIEIEERAVKTGP